MIHAFSALILGAVEGFTEFLPISSTAHLVLTSHLLGIAQTNFTKTFEIAIQSGAILAVVALYWRKFLDPEILKKILVSFIPTGILGFIFYKVIKTYLLGSIPVVLTSLALGGALLIIFEYLMRGKEGAQGVADMSYAQAAGIGVCQSVAMVPGVSRSAATIVGGMLMGLGREAIVEFSFLLAVPTMLAATALDIFKNFHAFSSAEFSALGIGLIASFVTAIISIKFLLGYIRKNSFIPFGVYRIVIVALFLFINFI